MYKYFTFIKNVYWMDAFCIICHLTKLLIYNFLLTYYLIFYYFLYTNLEYLALARKFCIFTLNTSLILKHRKSNKSQQLNSAMADKIYSAEQITVPSDLPKLLKGFTKEVIRYNPSDIPQFAIELSIF